MTDKEKLIEEIQGRILSHDSWADELNTIADFILAREEKLKVSAQLWREEYEKYVSFGVDVSSKLQTAVEALEFVVNSFEKSNQELMRGGHITGKNTPMTVLKCREALAAIRGEKEQKAND